jgi:hypothetical protein
MLPATISARKPIEQKTEQNKNVQQVDSNVDCRALHAPVANIALWIFHTLVALVFFFMYGVPTAIAYYTPFVLFEAACTVLIA